MTRIRSTLQHVGTFMTGYWRILLIMRNISDNIVGVIKTPVLCPITFFRKLCLLSENVQKYGTVGEAKDDNIIRRINIACWVTKATSTNSVYVIHIA